MARIPEDIAEEGGKADGGRLEAAETAEIIDPDLVYFPIVSVVPAKSPWRWAASAAEKSGFFMPTLTSKMKCKTSVAGKSYTDPILFVPAFRYLLQRPPWGKVTLTPFIILF